MSEMTELLARRLFLSRYPESEENWPDRLFEVTVETADSYREYARDALIEVRGHFERVAESSQFCEDKAAMFAAVEEIQEALA